MIGTSRAHRRRIGIAGLALGLASTVIPFLSATPASAAEIGTNHTVTATTGTQTNVHPGTPLQGLVDGQTVNIRVTEAGPTDQISGIVVARQCQGGVTIADSASLGPSNTGYCLDTPLSAGSDNVKGPATKLDPADNFIDISFRVGVGSESVNWDDGSPHVNTITCNASSACSLWLQIARSGGSDFVHYDLQFLGQPAAPTVSAACNAAGATVSLTGPTNNGNSPIASYTVSATSSDGGAAVAPVTVTAAATPPTTATLTGFTDFKHYDITATATNQGDQTGPASVASGSTAGVQTCFAGPVLLAPAVSPSGADLTWTYAGPAGATGFTVVVKDGSTTVATIPVTGGSATTATVPATGLTIGTVYTATVTANYASGDSAPSNAQSFVIPPNSLITQTITVRRPAGALVLTQVCTNVSPTTSPTLLPGGLGGDDPLFSQYPYPQDPTTGDSLATYPTDCGINMGPAKLITTGAGAGQFFKATGNLNQVTVVDTRDAAPGGWTVNGRMGTFTQAIPGATISGDELGWAPVKTSDTDGITFSDGSTYDQTVTAGAAVLPNQPNGTGLGSSTGKVLGSAPANARLGIAKLDAGLTLWIPITARTGNYTGTLTLTAI